MYMGQSLKLSATELDPCYVRYQNGYALIIQLSSFSQDYNPFSETLSQAEATNIEK